MARHRRKNRSLFPDKETIAKLTARSTVEARWRSLDVHTTEHENGIDDTFGDVTESEKEPEARSRCGESVFTARFPLVKSNGPKTVVPKATVRAEVRRADGCNHPALVRAVASAVRSTGGFQKKPSRKLDSMEKKNVRRNRASGRATRGCISSTACVSGRTTATAGWLASGTRGGGSSARMTWLFSASPDASE